MSLEKAKRIRKTYHRKLEALRIKARHGDKEAAHKIITTLTEFYTALEEVGYRTLDENESDKPGTLTPITQEWLDKRAAYQAKRADLEKRLHDPDSNVRLAAILELGRD